jgi:hypothetical protein
MAINAKLAGLLRQVKEDPVSFAFVPKGNDDGALLLSMTTVPPNQIEEAKAALGVHTVIRGQCTGGENTLNLVPEHAATATLAAQIKKVITRDTGLHFNVKVSPPEPGKGDPTTTPEVDATSFQEHWQRCEQKLKALAHAAPEKVKVWHAMLALAQKRAQEHHFKEGMTVLKELEAQLPAARPGDVQPAAKVEAQLQPAHADSPQDWEKWRGKIEPVYLAALKKYPAQRSKLETLWQFAASHATDGHYAKAIEALKMLPKLIAKAEQSAPATDAARHGIPENIVKERTKFLQSRWQQGFAQMNAEVEKFRSALTARASEGDVIGVADAVQRTLDSVCDQFAATTAKAGSLDAALKLVRDMKQTVQSDPLIQILKRAQSEVGTAVNVEGALLSALSDIENQLAS